jgi:hypothetical protein
MTGDRVPPMGVAAELERLERRLSRLQRRLRWIDRWLAAPPLLRMVVRLFVVMSVLYGLAALLGRRTLPAEPLRRGRSGVSVPLHTPRPKLAHDACHAAPRVGVIGHRAASRRPGGPLLARSAAGVALRRQAALGGPAQRVLMRYSRAGPPVCQR